MRFSQSSHLLLYLSLETQNLFSSSDPSICSVLPSLVNTVHLADSMSTDFPSNSNRDTTFHLAAFDYSFVKWDGLCDHLTDVSIFQCSVLNELSASGTAAELCD